MLPSLASVSMSCCRVLSKTTSHPSWNCSSRKPSPIQESAAEGTAWIRCHHLCMLLLSRCTAGVLLCHKTHTQVVVMEDVTHPRGCTHRAQHAPEARMTHWQDTRLLLSIAYRSGLRGRLEDTLAPVYLAWSGLLTAWASRQSFSPG